MDQTEIVFDSSELLKLIFPSEGSPISMNGEKFILKDEAALVELNLNVSENTVTISVEQN